MSLYTPLSKVIVGREAAADVTQPVVDDGQALVAGAAGVAPSTGAAGEIFVGFSFNQTSGAPYLPSTMVNVEEFVASGTTYFLKQTPVAGSILLVKDGASVVPANTGATLTGLTAGSTYKVVYTYVLTNAAAVAMFGNLQPGQHAGAVFGQTGVVEQGIVYITNFDTAQNYAFDSVLTLESGGRVSIGGAVTIGAKVVALPTSEIPFLGIEFSAL